LAFALTDTRLYFFAELRKPLQHGHSGKHSLLYHKPVRALDILLNEDFSGDRCLDLVHSASDLLLSIGVAEPPKDILLVLEAWVLLAWFGGALGFGYRRLTAFSE